MKHKGRKLLRTILLFFAVIIVAAAVFFGLFYVTDVEVVGNTRYSAAQISEMTLKGPVSYNSVLMSALNKTVYPDVAFVESVQVKYLGRNRLRLEVQEKYPIGYLDIDDVYYYFDKDGLVLEAIAKSSIKEESADTNRTENSKAADSSAESAQSLQQTEGTSGGDSTVEKAAHNSADTVFHPALTDVPRVEGIEASNITVGSVMKVNDPAVFQIILSLTKLIDKFGIQPDYVEFSKDLSMTLHYDQVRIQIGGDSLLEEKVSRVAAILPELDGLSGVLHLEDYAKDTQNIIFDRDKRTVTEKSEQS